MFSKILIANRGEIAVRIIRACREMGVATVAVHSLCDRDSLHVELADEHICIGGNSVAESYLNMESILSAAEVTGASAIHPGYGLLSENSHFAALCEKFNLPLVGPSSEIIERMGNKEEARRTMKAAGVPVVPGTDVISDLVQAKKEAKAVGFPLLCKARSGGGGRGIRLVERAEDFESAFLTAGREAQTTFGDGGIYLERFLSGTKHIEIQLLCDKHGNVLSLGERDCSLQRRRQKMLEESPANNSAMAKTMLAAFPSRGFSICSACVRSVTGVFVTKNVAAAMRIIALLIAQPIIMETSVSPNSYFSCFLMTVSSCKFHCLL